MPLLANVKNFYFRGSKRWMTRNERQGKSSAPRTELPGRGGSAGNQRRDTGYVKRCFTEAEEKIKTNAAGSALETWGGEGTLRGRGGKKALTRVNDPV